MLIVVNDRRYRISFQYTEPRVTACIIWCVGNETHTTHVQVRREAVCSPSDNFNRSMGRRIALTRALKAIFLREERKKAWDERWKMKFEDGVD